ncbi:hypothetical protein HOG17_00115 [Candidatus Peregrinibacteria bacterium]|jgi:hypothetical protein|nr:hypothetical protein [Candidatus Peregrinibacteria bacterium]MBT4147665.1 hypothetical protein [Candidatus Peregrinibacteria bacterium]MBT4366279.1 hypothetical protein [Candidatus Peregrinibacteria bacterium]MBT4455793.1 hypothetical protein [Candidatus Peregrinibacteria bacterium]
MSPDPVIVDKISKAKGAVAELEDKVRSMKSVLKFLDSVDEKKEKDGKLAELDGLLGDL